MSTSQQWLRTPPTDWGKARKALLAICEVYGLQAQAILPIEGEFERGEVTLAPDDFAFLCSALKAIQWLVNVPRQDGEVG